jgi:small-conductance mechanosensitive channel
MSTTEEAQARELGWRPQDEFTGEPSKWVDAATYIKNGENVVPYLRADRRKLLSTVEQLRTQIDQQAAVVRANNESIEALKKISTSQRVTQLESEVKSLRQQLVAARQSGDAAEQAEIEELLDTTRDTLKEVRAEATKPSTSTSVSSNGSQSNGTQSNQDYVNSPEFQQFLGDNPWFKEDQVMAAAAVSLMQVKSADPTFRTKTPAQRFMLVAQEIRTRFGMDEEPRRQRDSKVEGGRGGEQRRTGSSRGGTKSFIDLSPGAQAACDKLAKRVVGPKGSGRAYETLDAWRAHYASQVEE